MGDKYENDKYENDKYKNDKYENDKYENDKYESDKYETDKYESDTAAEDIAKFLQQKAFLPLFDLSMIWFEKQKMQYKSRNKVLMQVLRRGAGFEKKLQDFENVVKHMFQV